MFLIKPLVVRNMSCHLNLGAQFNFKTGLIPQTVKQGADGKKVNFSELDGIQVRLQFQDVSNATLQRTIGDPEFLPLLKKETTTQTMWNGVCITPHLTPCTYGSTGELVEDVL